MSDASGRPTATGRGGIANLHPASTSDEARERGRRGGIASGVARRRRISIRDELTELLAAGEGMVAKSIVAAMCHEAKRGNVGAFRAIAQVMGELKEVVGIEASELPPPFVISIHNPAFVEAERKRQAAAMAEVVDTEMVNLTASAGEAAKQLTAKGSGGTASAKKRRRASRNAPRGAGHGDAHPDAPSDCRAVPAPIEPPPFRAPRTPSEAAAIRREREAAERAANHETQQPQQSGAGPAFITPIAFPRR